MASPMSLSEQLSRNLEVHPAQPDHPDEHGIWIRIPTRLIAVDDAASAGAHVARPAPPNPTPPEQPPSAASASSAAAVAVGTGVFRAQGDLREITYGGTATTIKDMQGFRILAQLLSRPHTNVSAVELRCGLAGVQTAMFAGSSGPMVTGEAMADLRRSYEDLNEELAEAESNNDEGRMRKLQAEIHALAEHLRVVTGKNGAPRRQSDAERARVAVTQAVRRALNTLRTTHVKLHDHLGRSVRSGSVLAYRPEVPMRWQT